MNTNDNTIVTKTRDRFNVTIVDLQKEILETQEEIYSLIREYENVLVDIRSARESFRNKFGCTAIRDGIARDSKEFQTMKELECKEEVLNEKIAWAKAYLKGLTENIKFDITYSSSCDYTKAEIEQLVKILYKKFLSWVSLLEPKFSDDLNEIAINIDEIEGDYTLDIELEWEDGEEALGYYLCTFENRMNNKILSLQATLYYETLLS